MGRIVLFIFVFFLFSFIVVSGSESYDVDFSSLRSHAVYLYEDDEVRFQLLGGEHTIIIEDVGTSSIKVDIGLFLNNQSLLTPGLIGLDYIMRLDLDKDGVTDLNVALYSISEDGLVHLVLQDVTAQDPGDLTGNVGLVDEVVGFESKTVVLFIIGILVLVLVLFLVFRNNSFFEDDAKKPEEAVSEEKVVEVQASVQDASISTQDDLK